MLLLAMTTKKDKQAFYVTAVVLLVAVVLVIWYILKKSAGVFRTESPVMDETSKKILKDESLTRNYYDAIEQEKLGKEATITVEGEEFIIKRAGKHSHSVAAA